MQVSQFLFILVLLIADQCLVEYAHSDVATQKGAIVLVPGTLTSGLPGGSERAPESSAPNFSQIIIDTLKAQGYAIHVIRGLDPIGTNEANGSIVLQDMVAWYDHQFSGRQIPITLIGHSAGGLYALHALKIDAGRLPVRNLIMIATPLNGSEIADYFFNKDPGGLQDDFVDLLERFIDLRGLEQLTTQGVAEFLERTEIASDIRIFTAIGIQPPPRWFFDLFDANYLCLICTPGTRLIHEESDGVVGFSSAMGTHAKIRSIDGGYVKINQLSDLKPNLDHFEEVLDYRLLKSLGTQNASIIKDEQKRFYSELIKHIEK